MSDYVIVYKENMYYMDVFKNGENPPNHPILIGFSIINHPFWGTPIFGNTNICQKEHVGNLAVNTLAVP